MMNLEARCGMRPSERVKIGATGFETRQSQEIKKQTNKQTKNNEEAGCKFTEMLTRVYMGQQWTKLTPSRPWKRGNM